MLQRIAILLLAASVLALVANSLSPVAVGWDKRWREDMRARAIVAGIEPVDTKTMEAIVREGSALVVDARGEANYRAAHIPGARRKTQGRVGKERAIVVYCNSTWCEAALVLGQELRAKGYRRVGLYVDGIDAWMAAGNEVDHD